MLKKIINLMKKIFISIFLLYGLNILINPLKILIPINIITISSITLLGLPAMFALIFIHVLIY